MLFESNFNFMFFFSLLFLCYLRLSSILCYLKLISFLCYLLLCYLGIHQFQAIGIKVSQFYTAIIRPEYYNIAQRKYNF